MFELTRLAPGHRWLPPRPETVADVLDGASKPGVGLARLRRYGRVL